MARQELLDLAKGSITALYISYFRIPTRFGDIILEKPLAVIIETDAENEVKKVITYQPFVNGEEIDRGLYKNLETLFKALGIGIIKYSMDHKSIWSIDDFLKVEGAIKIVDEEPLFTGAEHEMLSKLQAIKSILGIIPEDKKYEVKKIVCRDIATILDYVTDLDSVIETLESVQKAREKANEALKPLISRRKGFVIL